MKVLLFEYITGGGFSGRDLPASLAREGEMMVQALWRDLSQVPNVAVAVMRDARLAPLDCRAAGECIEVHAEPLDSGGFDRLLQDCDAVWPIAPETGGILERYCLRAEAAGKALLVPAAAAVRACGDKLRCFQLLAESGIPTVPTFALPDALPADCRAWVIKSRDGAGCADSHIVRDALVYRRLADSLSDPDNYVLQPLVNGTAASLSALFKAGQGVLLSYNRQGIEELNNAFELRACSVNAPCADSRPYQQLASRVAQAFPELWGYAGIDIIVTEHGPLVVEINPRLTTSYAGLSQALQTNVAEHVLGLLAGGLPEIRPTDITVDITIVTEHADGN